jgi:predicted NUDIX family phosphoesterase
MLEAFFQFGNLYTGKERILVLPNEVVFVTGRWQGFMLNTSWGCEFEQIAEEHGEWVAREQAEQDPNVQQVIPFGVYRVGNRYLELKRGSEGAHTRLYNVYTLGIGGHVMQGEFQQWGNLVTWMRHKFSEEIGQQGQMTVNCVGALNDNSDDLGKHHFAIVYLIEGTSDHLTAQKHAEIRLVTLREITGSDVNHMDRWSQMIYRQLRDAEAAGTI